MIAPSSNQPLQPAVDPDTERANQANMLARRPTDIVEAGISETLVYDLVIKHLYRGGIMDIKELTERLALAGPVLGEKVSSLT